MFEILLNYLLKPLPLNWTTSRNTTDSQLILRKQSNPVLYKIFKFLLMYIQYDSSSSSGSGSTSNSGNNSVIQYLHTTSDGRILAIEDCIVMLLYLPNNLLKKHRILPVEKLFSLCPSGNYRITYDERRLFAGYFDVWNRIKKSFFDSSSRKVGLGYDRLAICESYQ